MSDLCDVLLIFADQQPFRCPPPVDIRLDAPCHPADGLGLQGEEVDKLGVVVGERKHKLAAFVGDR